MKTSKKATNMIVIRSRMTLEGSTKKALRLLVAGLAILLSVTFSIAQTVSFETATSIDMGTYASSLAVGDLNNDEIPDLAVTKHGLGTGVGNFASILLGDGSGSFGTATDFSVGADAGADPRSVAIGDLNGDGIPDLVVSSPSSTSNDVISILLGIGDGTFTVATNFDVGSSPTSAAIGDLNGDAKPDLAVAHGAPGGNVAILLGDGTGSFGAATNFGVGPGPTTVVIGDLNRDGILDLATANSSYVYNYSDHVSVLLGIGDGTFHTAVHFAGPTTVGNTSWSLAIGDLNGDGKPDLATANTSDYVDHVSVLPGDGNGSFGEAMNYDVSSTSLGSGMRSVAIRDLNGDGKLDLALAGGNSVFILLNATPSDSDNDGIFNNVDPEPNTHSDEFDDGVTTGKIIDPGDQILTIQTDPEGGISIETDCSGGSVPATIEVICNSIVMDIELPACSKTRVECTSAKIWVSKGSARVTFYADGWTQAKVNLVMGNGLSFEATLILTAESTNSDNLVVIVEGREFSLAAGESKTIEKCSLPLIRLIVAFLIAVLLGFLICWWWRKKHIAS